MGEGRKERDRTPRAAFSAVVGLAVCLVLLAPPSPARAASIPTPELAVGQLNAWRQMIGVQPVTLENSLSAGCRQHATYYRANPGARGHGEVVSAPGYTEAGDKAARSSVLAYGPGMTNLGVRVWEPAPYHRMALLDPRLSTTGFWGEFGIGCMDVSKINNDVRTAGLTAYTYPVSGQRDIPTTFLCNEVPNPCAVARGNDGRIPTGFNISVQFNGPWNRISDVFVTHAELTPLGAPPVSVTVDSDNGVLRGGFLLIPEQPLAAGTTYVAAASGTVVATADDGTTVDHPFGLSWDFSTPGVAPAASLKVIVERVTRSAIHVRLDLRSNEARRARISLLNKRTALVRLIRELSGGSKRVVIPRPRERVTTVAVLLRGTATQVGVAARLKTNIHSRR